MERNALSAEVVKRAEHWGWGSLWLRHQAAKGDQTQAMMQMLSPGPQGRWPALGPWTAGVNAAQTKKELSRLDISERRSLAFGSEAWTCRTVVNLNLEHTIRAEGCPRQAKKEVWDETTSYVPVSLHR